MRVGENSEFGLGVVAHPERKAAVGIEVSSRELIAGMGSGGACMYALDPDRGRSRRVLLRDKTASAYRRVPVLEQEASPLLSGDSS